MEEFASNLKLKCKTESGPHPKLFQLGGVCVFRIEFRNDSVSAEMRRCGDAEMRRCGDAEISTFENEFVWARPSEQWVHAKPRKCNADLRILDQQTLKDRVSARTYSYTNAFSYHTNDSSNGYYGRIVEPTAVQAFACFDGYSAVRVD
jgi:hypothetical protein